MFAETGLVVTPFLPGDSLLFAAGALAATGALTRWPSSAVLLAAAIAGNAVNYAVGRTIGPRVFSGARRVQPVAPAAEPRPLDQGARVLRAVRRQGGRARTVRADRPHVRAVRGRRRRDDATRVRVLQRRRRGAWVGSVLGAGYAVRQRPIVKENFSLVDDRHRRRLAAAGGGRVPPSSRGRLRATSAGRASTEAQTAGDSRGSARPSSDRRRAPAAGLPSGPRCPRGRPRCAPGRR